MSVLILYSYHEKENSKKNLISFLENTVYKNNYHIYINVNGKSSINFNKYKNVNIFYNNFKFNAYIGWFFIINKININDYKYFIFVKDKILFTNKIDWINILICNIDNNVKIISPFFGFSWSDIPILASALFCTDLIGLKLVLSIQEKIDILRNLHGLRQKSPEYLINKLIYNNGYEGKVVTYEESLYKIRRENSLEKARKIIYKKIVSEADFVKINY
jgi:hypothetical protein